MIVLWGLANDPPLARVQAALAERGARTFFVDQRRGLDLELELEASATVSGELRLDEERVALAEIQAGYVRPHDACRVVAAGDRPLSAEVRERLGAFDDALLAWVDLTPARIVNRPSAMASNGSKPYQGAIIRRHGFALPETVVTTDPADVRAFLMRHGEVIFKSVSGVRSVVTRLQEEDFERLSLVQWCPTQFQQYVRGMDYRVHVVGPDAFACQIVSTGDDYRYATGQGHAVDMCACTLPTDVTERCIELARALDLSVAGIDLRRTIEGVWHCFEVNPSPGFTFYEDAVGQPIAASIAELLIGSQS